MNRAPRPYRLPLASWLLGLPGVACLLAGIALVAGDFGEVHPLLGGEAAALALIVSAVALLGSAAFPAVIRRLEQRDDALKETPGRPKFS
jgi:hypothetical protein